MLESLVYLSYAGFCWYIVGNLKPFNVFAAWHKATAGDLMICWYKGFKIIEEWKHKDSGCPALFLLRLVKYVLQNKTSMRHRYCKIKQYTLFLGLRSFIPQILDVVSWFGFGYFWHNKIMLIFLCYEHWCWIFRCVHSFSSFLFYF